MEVEVFWRTGENWIFTFMEIVVGEDVDEFTVDSAYCAEEDGGLKGPPYAPTNI